MVYRSKSFRYSILINLIVLFLFGSADATKRGREDSDSDNDRGESIDFHQRLNSLLKGAKTGDAEAQDELKKLLAPHDTEPFYRTLASVGDIEAQSLQELQQVIFPKTIPSLIRKIEEKQKKSLRDPSKKERAENYGRFLKTLQDVRSEFSKALEASSYTFIIPEESARKHLSNQLEGKSPSHTIGINSTVRDDCCLVFYDANRLAIGQEHVRLQNTIKQLIEDCYAQSEKYENKSALLDQIMGNHKMDYDRMASTFNILEKSHAKRYIINLESTALNTFSGRVSQLLPGWSSEEINNLMQGVKQKTQVDMVITKALLDICLAKISKAQNKSKQLCDIVDIFTYALGAVESLKMEHFKKTYGIWLVH
jgi:hypothetical protein